jgi:hypothetical protein
MKNQVSIHLHQIENKILMKIVVQKLIMCKEY